MVSCVPKATKFRLPCPFLPKAFFPRFGDLCFNLGISPNAFRLRLVLELLSSIRPIVESEVALLKFCLNSGFLRFSVALLASKRM